MRKTKYYFVKERRRMVCEYKHSIGKRKQTCKKLLEKNAENIKKTPWDENEDIIRKLQKAVNIPRRKAEQYVLIKKMEIFLDCGVASA